jgi:SulP family sulfate permease
MHDGISQGAVNMNVHAKIPELSALIPSLGWLPAYRKELLRPDVIAGLTAASVVIPKAMAYAAIAGLPVEVGLYTIFIPMVIYAVLGTSRPLSVSTTTTIAILTATELALAAPNGTPGEYLAAASTLALLVGAMLVLAAVLRLGFIANFISDPVLTGFKAGIGLVIVVDQVPKLLGQHFDKGGFFQNIISIVHDLPDLSVPTLIVSLVMLALIFGMEHFRPQSPAPLLAVIAGIAASALLGLEDKGVSIVGDISAGLPAFKVPVVSLASQLWPGALGIALMSFVETIAAGRAFLKHGEPHPEANNELFALGLANIIGGFFRIMPAGGGTSQTAVTRKAGAHTQVAGMVTASIAVATLLFLAPLVGIMPQATLAAVVVATSIGLVNPAEFSSIRYIRHVEFRWAVVAFLGVIFLGTLKGILVAVIVSMLSLLHQANKPPVYALGRIPGTDVFRPLSREHPGDETFEGLLMLRTEGRMHFASAPQSGQKMRALVQEYNPKVVMLDLSAVPDIEYTALRMLTEAEETLREAGITLWLSALNPEALNVIRQAPLGKTLGRERMFYNLNQAVENYQTMVR